MPQSPSLIAIPRPLLRGTRGAVACGHPLAVSAALFVFRDGGNAADAAIAAAAVLAVVLPDACGLGGDAMLLVRTPNGSVQALNGSGAAPTALALPVPRDGAGTAAVPGAVAAWEATHRRFGRVPFSATLEPAIALARDGYPVSERLLATVEAQRSRLERSGRPWALLDRRTVPGACLRQLDLARVLRHIAESGSAGFYAGPVADAIERTVREEGGSLSVSDLAAHRTIERRPVVATYRQARLWLQPPVSQALLAAMVLRELESFDLPGDEERVHLAVEAVEAAFGHRDEIAAPDSDERLLARRLDVDTSYARRHGGPRASAHTTAVVTADSGGMIVSQLVSVFDTFGSASLVPEGGFFLNDRLTGFSTDPDSPNAPAPGRRPVHTLSPALIDDGTRVFALATPGADGQVQVLVQLIDALVREARPIPEALGAPRWRSVEGRLAVEAGFQRGLAQSLTKRGHSLVWHAAGDELFGSCAVAGFDRETETLFAAADPRRETWAGVC